MSARFDCLEMAAEGKQKSGRWRRVLVSCLFVCIILLWLVRPCTASYEDEFTEELVVRPLSGGYVYSYFQFTTKWNVTPETSSHFHLFPKSLGEILFKYHVRELHFSLSHGLWRHHAWGYPVDDVAPGMELWVWFQETVSDVDARYEELTNALSGLFCASLNFIESSNTVQPKVSFRPRGVVRGNFSGDPSFVRYSILPREVVCTENLTPWKKLLPCDTKEGLSTLLNAARLYNSAYNALAVHVRPICEGLSCSKVTLELAQTVSLVSDMRHLSRNNQDWSFARLYGRTLTSSCAVAKFSKVYVDVSSNETTEQFLINPHPTTVTKSIVGSSTKNYAVYDVPRFLAESTNKILNVASSYSQPLTYGIQASPPLYVNRFVTGYGQEGGGICSLIHNAENEPITIVYMEMIPWFLRTFLHTLEITSNNLALKPVFQHYVPSEDRKRPTLLEIALVLPPRSSTKIRIQFEHTLLKWTEYPPDANHGFYVGSAIVSAQLSSAKNYTGLLQQASTYYSSFNLSHLEYFIRIHSEPLLILLPTPDFSMPYNAICLTCTVIALAFGPIHNLTIKRLEIKDSSKPSFKNKIKKIVNQVVETVKQKLSKKKVQEKKKTQ